MRRVAAGAFHADTPFAAYMSCVTCVHHVCAAFAAPTACCVSVLRACRLCSPHMFTVVWWRAWSPAVQSVEVSAAVVVCCSCVVGVAALFLAAGMVAGGVHQWWCCSLRPPGRDTLGETACSPHDRCMAIGLKPSHWGGRCLAQMTQPDSTRAGQLCGPGCGAQQPAPTTNNSARTRRRSRARVRPPSHGNLLRDGRGVPGGGTPPLAAAMATSEPRSARRNSLTRSTLCRASGCPQPKGRHPVTDTQEDPKVDCHDREHPGGGSLRARASPAPCWEHQPTSTRWSSARSGAPRSDLCLLAALCTVLGVMQNTPPRFIPFKPTARKNDPCHLRGRVLPPRRNPPQGGLCPLLGHSATAKRKAENGWGYVVRVHDQVYYDMGRVPSCQQVPDPAGLHLHAGSPGPDPGGGGPSTSPTSRMGGVHLSPQPFGVWRLADLEYAIHGAAADLAEL